MSWEAEFEELMSETVQVRKRTGFAGDGYGTVQHGAAGTARKAHVVRETKLVTDAQGQERVSAWTVYVAGDPDPDMTVDDVLVLPDGSTPPVVAVTRRADEDSNRHHYVVQLGPGGGGGDL